MLDYVMEAGSDEDEEYQDGLRATGQSTLQADKIVTHAETRSEPRIIVPRPAPSGNTIFVEKVISIPALLVPQDSGNNAEARKSLVYRFVVGVFVRAAAS